MYSNNYQKNKIDFFFEGILSYFRSEWILLFNPKYAFSQVNKSQKKPFLLNPAVFLTINISLIYLLFKIPTPIKSQFLNDALKIFYEPSLLAQVILRYVLGIVIFVVILKLFFRSVKIKILLHNVYAPICYASATYLPIALLKRLLGYSAFTPFLNLCTQILSYSKLMVSYSDIIRIVILPFLGFFISIYWWGSLFYLGIKNTFAQDLKNIGRKILCSVVFLIIIQYSLLWVFLIGQVIPLFRSAADWYNAKQVVSEKSPNYFKAALLFEQVAQRKEVTPSVQYRAKISAVVCKLGTILVNKEKTGSIFEKALKEINNKNYREAEKLLSVFLEKASNNQNDPYRNNYIDLLEEVKQAINYRNWKYFSDKEEVSITFMASIKESPVPVLFP